MADTNLKALESERKQLWATCRLKGLARDSKERIRIDELDEQIRTLKDKIGFKPKSKKKRAGKAAKSGAPAAPFRTYGQPKDESE